MGNPQDGAVSGGPDVFVSYAREDRAPAAELVRILRSQRLDVAWDADLKPATDFRAEIERFLEQSHLVVVLWSGWSVNSDHVRDEADYARERHKLVPASLDGRQPPLGFRGLQTEDLRGWVVGSGHPGVDRLVGVIRARLAGPVPPQSPPPSQPRPPVPRQVRRRRKPVGTVIGILTALVVLALVALLTVVAIRELPKLFDGDGDGVEVLDFRVQQILDLCEVNVGWLTDGQGNNLDVRRDGTVVAESQPASVGNIQDDAVPPGPHVYTLAIEGEPVGDEARIDLEC